MVVFGGCVAVGPACLPRIGEGFSLSLSQRGLLGSVLMSALLASLLVAGHYADRTGKRPFLVAGMVVIGLGLAFISRANAYLALLLGNAMLGAGKGAMEALVNPLVAELDPYTAPRRLNIVNGMFSVGLVIAAVAAGEMLIRGVSWRTVYLPWIPAALIVAWLFAARHYPRPVAPPEAADGTGAASIARFLKSPVFWVLVVAMVMGGGCEAGMTFWGANFTEREFGATDRTAALTVAVFGAFMAVGRFGTGALVTRMRPITLMQVSAGLCALATLGLYFVQGLYGAWAMYALGGLFVACFWPTLLAVAALEIESGSAALFALLAAAGIAGCGLFPWVIGKVGDLAGLRAGSLVLPISMVIELLTLLVAARLAGNGDESRVSPSSR